METKSEKYSRMFKQAEALMEGENHLVSILSNISALLHDTFPDRFFWSGFYIVKGEELILGPFQGPVACTHIQKGRGVCGAAWKEKKTILVADVEQFPGHIACSSLSRSEIVVPVKIGNVVWGVIDIDSIQPDSFEEEDQKALEALAAALSRKIKSVFNFQSEKYRG